MKVFYSDKQNVPTNKSFSPSAGKPALAIASWKKLDPAIDIREFPPATREQLYKVHHPQYVDGVLDLRSRNGFGNKLPEVAAALPYVAGSMVAAALHAYQTGETSISPTSGAHHAGYAHGGGFCTFNFLALAAVEAHAAGAKQIGIFDCDQHYGDGTAEIILHLKLDYIKHHSYAGKGITWLRDLSHHVEAFTKDIDLLIYNAGADCHIDDPLGGAFTTEELHLRDKIIFAAAKRNRVPVAVSLAGGYQSDIRNVLEVHDNMYLTAMEKMDRIASWGEGALGPHFDEPGSAEIARDALERMKCGSP